MNQPALSRRKFLSLGTGSLAFALMPFGHLRPVPHVALIGAGAQGLRLLRTLQSLPVRVTGVADVRAEALEQAAVLAPGTALTQDVNRLLNSPAADAVLIATPDFSHVDLAQAALRVGKAVYLEPPLTPTLTSLRTLQHTARLVGRNLYSGDFSARHPVYALAAQIVGAGILGTLERIRITVHTPCAAPPVHWQYQAENSYGAVFTQLAQKIGQVQHICRVKLSTPTRISAHGGTFVATGPQTTPDTLFAMLQFGKSFSVSFAALVGDPGQDVFTLQGTHGTLDIPRGHLDTDQVDARVVARIETQLDQALHARADLLAEHLSAWLHGLHRPGAAAEATDAAVVEVTEDTCAAFYRASGRPVGQRVLSQQNGPGA